MGKCDHEVCNRDLEEGPSAEEVNFVLSCMVERGLVNWVGVNEEGQNVFRLAEFDDHPESAVEAVVREVAERLEE